MAFKKATKTQSKARVALISPSGAGKTMTALRIARGLAGPDGRIAVLDTERGSASKYADRFEFDVDDDFSGFAPAVYVDKIKAAAQGGYDVLLIDSLSHAWNGKDGALEQVDRAKGRSGGNAFAGWKDVTPEHNRMVDAIVTAPMHVIVTLRAKTEYVLEEDARGKKVPRKVGIGAVQRDGLEYEFDIVGELDHDHVLSVTKSRCSELAEYQQKFADEDFGAKLRAWLTDGAAANPDSLLPTNIRRFLGDFTAAMETRGATPEEARRLVDVRLAARGVRLIDVHGEHMTNMVLQARKGGYDAELKSLRSPADQAQGTAPTAAPESNAWEQFTAAVRPFANRDGLTDSEIDAFTANVASQFQVPNEMIPPGDLALLLAAAKDGLLDWKTLDVREPAAKGGKRPPATAAA